jgi:hypothetical protein
MRSCHEIPTSLPPPNEPKFRLTGHSPRLRSSGVFVVFSATPSATEFASPEPAQWASSGRCESAVLSATAATTTTTAATAAPTRRARGTTAPFATKPATPAPATTTTATATTGGRTPLTGDVHGDGATIERRTIERLNGSLGFLVAPVLDEPEPTRLARCSIDDDASRGYLAELGEGLLQLLVHRRVRQVAHIQPVSHC